MYRKNKKNTNKTKFRRLRSNIGAKYYSARSYRSNCVPISECFSLVINHCHETDKYRKMSDSNSSPTPAKDTGYTPGDDFSTQWRNIFSILTGRMTPEGQEQFRLAKDIRNEAADCKRCEDQRDYLLQFSEFIPYTLQAFLGMAA